jgi:hypothetical protein
LAAETQGKKLCSFTYIHIYTDYGGIYCAFSYIRQSFYIY